MSIKLYEAYRIELKRLNDFIDVARDQMFKDVVHRVHELARTLELSEGKAEDFRKEFPFSVGERDRAAWKFRVEKALEVARVSVRTGYGQQNINCGLNIWISGGDVLVVPVNNIHTLRVEGLGAVYS